MVRIDSTNRTAFDVDSSMPEARDAGTREAPSVLPSPNARLQTSGDVGAMIAAMLLSSAQTSREIARRTRDAAAAAEDVAQAQKIEHMEEAAKWRFVGGVTGGAMKVASGAAEGGGEIGRNYPIKAASKPLEGGGDVGKSITDYVAAQEDIEVQHADRALTQAKRNVDAASEMDRDSKELLNRTLGYYAEYMRAKEDATKAALFRA